MNNNTPPRSEFQTPAQFVAAAGARSDHLKQVLGAHVAGAEAGWDAFERKIAQWYADICDRAEGWYKRASAQQLLWVSLALTVAINADSAFIARTLLENDNLRISFANVGELLADQLADEKSRAAGNPPPLREKLNSAAAQTSPFAVSGELNRALGEIRAAATITPELMGFGDNKEEIAQECAGKKNEGKLYASNYDAWPHLMAAILGSFEEASLGISSTQPEYLQGGTIRLQNIRHAMVCTTAVAKWLHAAQYSAKNKDASAHLKEAILALERAREGMQALIARTTVYSNLVKSYAVLGKDFADCAAEAGNSRATFDRCLTAANTNSIPFGWPSQAGQFCKVTMPAGPAPVAVPAKLPASGPPAEQLASGWDAWWGCEDYPGNAALELPPIYATFKWAKFFGAMFGLGLTTVLVSLGAPFWYGLLGKIAQLRMAGRVRGLEDAAPAAATGTVSPDATLAPAPASVPVQPNPAMPFDSARNEFERVMQPKEISRLQIALGVTPTMDLDEVTRNAIAARLAALGQPPDRELGPSSYFMIVGRNTAQVAADAPSSAVWSIGHRDPDMVRKLIQALNTLIPAATCIPLPDGEIFDHALRARVVLFRFKADKKSSAIQKDVVALANSATNELMRLDEPTRRAILTFAPSPARFASDASPWLDYAYGELGVRENEGAPAGQSRAAAYLTSMNGDPAADPVKTSWCGAFVGWVLMQAGRLDTKRHPALLKAEKWLDFGAPGTGEHGEICIVDTGAGPHHVAFLIEIDAEGRHWLLGGNQGDTGLGGVSLVPFKASNKFTFRTVS